MNGDRSAAQSLGSSYGTVSATWTTNPATGQPWTEAEVDALQAGVESAVVYGTGLLRVTQLTVEVHVEDGTTYVYDAAGLNQLVSLDTGSVTTTYTYDDHGNLLTKATGGSTWSYEWTPGNLLARALLDGAQQQGYEYDALGRRVRVNGTDDSTWTVSLFRGMDVVYEVDQAGAKTKYARAAGRLIGQVTPAGAYHNYVGDHLGSTRQVWDANRNSVFAAEYEPFGKAYGVSGSEGYRYTGERQDEATGLVLVAETRLGGVHKIDGTQDPLFVRP